VGTESYKLKVAPFCFLNAIRTILNIHINQSTVQAYNEMGNLGQEMFFDF
jgi:hypothetical protein